MGSTGVPIVNGIFWRNNPPIKSAGLIFLGQHCFSIGTKSELVLQNDRFPQFPLHTNFIQPPLWAAVVVGSRRLRGHVVGCAHNRVGPALALWQLLRDLRSWRWTSQLEPQKRELTVHRPGKTRAKSYFLATCIELNPGVPLLEYMTHPWV